VIQSVTFSTQITSHEQIMQERSLGDHVAEDKLAPSPEKVTHLITAFVHDVRGPLNVASGYADLLGMDSSGPLNTRQKKFVERIQSEMRAIEQLLVRHQHHIEETLQTATEKRPQI
jgi:signal transduction histidine kinase